MTKAIAIFITAALLFNTVYAQQNSVSVYPRTLGYISFVNPIVALDKNGAKYNFTDGYALGFPTGINVLKSDKVGFSFEVTPFIKFTRTTSKVNNVLFHPGIMFRYPKGFTLLTRLAFETSGRYGGTLVFNKIFYRTKINNYFIAVPVPFRLGNEKPASIGVSVQLGVTF